MMVRPTRVLRREPSRSEPRPHVAALLSALLPGLGQLYVGRARRAAWSFALPAGALTAIASATLLIDPLQSFVVRQAAIVLLVVLGGLLGYHLAVVLDAYAIARAAATERRPRGLFLVGLAIVGLLVLYGSAYQRSSAWAGLLAGVMETAPAPQNVVARGARRTPPPDWTGRERYNLLVLGLDSRTDDEGETQNTDTMILLSLDPINKTGAMISIPRDVYVDLKEMGNEKVNAAYTIGGPDLSRRVVEQLLGIRVNAYAIVDFDAFTKIVDAFGGVLVDVRLPVRDELYPTAGGGVERLDIVAGPQLMDGTTALKYARSRHGSNDFSRARRQQEILAALKARLGRDNAILRLPSIVDRVGSAVRTNVAARDVLPIARLVASIDSKAITSVVLVPCGSGEDRCTLVEENRPDGYYLFPDAARIKALVGEVLPDPVRR